MSSVLSQLVLIEDDPDISLVAKLALEADGVLKVTTCSSGEEALRVVPAILPQLILLDVMMPGMDGPQTLEELGQVVDLSTIVVVFMTARVQPEEIARYRSLGAADVLKKPFDPMALAQRVHTVWDAHGPT